MHEEVRLPALVYLTNVLPEKSYMVRTDRTLHEGHFGLVRRLTALSVIAADAGAHQILP